MVRGDPRQHNCVHALDLDELALRASLVASAVPRPFVRWAGSKRAHLGHLIDLLPEKFGTYYEPFLGSGALFFLLQPDRARLNDECAPLMNTYRAVREGAAKVARYLKPLRPDPDLYYEIREREPRGRFRAAADFIYLNKTCWNGLYRVNSSGRFNVPYGRPKSDQIADLANIRACGRALSKPAVRLLTGDFEAALAGAKANDLVFLDPPYVTGHENNGFIDYNERLFSWSDQERLAEVALELADAGAHVVITNANHPAIRKLYPNFEHTPFSRQSTIASNPKNRRRVSELLIHR